MPYKTMKDANPALKGIKPTLSVEQANMIAGWADKISKAKDAPDSPWAVAIAQFKKAFTVRDGKWVARKKDESKTTPEAEMAKKFPPAEESAEEFEEYAEEDELNEDETSHAHQSGGGSKLAAEVRRLRKDVGEMLARLQSGQIQSATLTMEAAPAQGPKDFAELDTVLAKDETQARINALLEAFGQFAEAAAGDIAKLIELTKALTERLVKEQEPGEEGEPDEGGDESDASGAVVSKNTSAESKLEAIAGAFISQFCPPPEEGKENPPYSYVRQTYIEDKFVIAFQQGEYFKVPYTETADGYAFADKAKWEKVEQAFVAAEGNVKELGEMFAPAAAILESIEESADGQKRPMKMTVELIQPGWGNQRDNHHYSKEMLRRCAHRFIGKKMYESDHADQISTKEWVSTITDIKGFSDAGAPIAEVVVHSDDFASRCKNLKAENLLPQMECSLIATGKAEPDFTEGTRTGFNVTDIVEVERVDWVTRAGAGGRATEIIAESAEGKPPAQAETAAPSTKTTPPPAQPVQTEEAAASAQVVVKLNEAQVKKALSESTLPAEAQKRLTGLEYVDAAELDKAIEREIEYIKEVSGSGKVFGMGRTASESAAARQLDDKQREENINAIFAKYVGK